LLHYYHSWVKKGDFMKRILLVLVFVYTSQTLLTCQLPKERDEQAEEMTKEGCNLIDSIFEQALISIAGKEEVMSADWFNKRDEINKMQNIITDSIVIFSFDQNRENPVPGLLQEYLEIKIHEDAAKVFDMHGVSVKNIKSFYELSHTLCELSGGTDCEKMMRHIKSENLHLLLKLKIQKESRKHLRKEDAHELRQRLLLGSRIK